MILVPSQVKMKARAWQRIIPDQICPPTVSHALELTVCDGSFYVSN